MKTLITISLLLLATSSFSQVVSGFHDNGKPGKKIVLHGLGTTSTYFLNPNDSTFNFDSSKVVTDVTSNSSTDSIYVYRGGVFVRAIKVGGGSGSGTPGGSNTNVQYNSVGAFAGSSQFTYTPTTGINITGGKDTIIGGFHEEIAFSAINSDNTKAAIKILLTNTNATNGQIYELKSNSDGSFSIRNSSSATTKFFISKTGGVALGGGTVTSGSYATVNGGNLDVLNGGFKVNGTFSTGPSGAGPELEWDGTQSYFSSVNRSAGFQQKPLNIRTSGMVVGLNQTVDASLIFDVQSTTKGARPVPAMTTSQRDAIASKATWSQVICTDCTATDASTGVLQVWNGTAWKNAW